jgi:hypothetical protein
MVLPLFSYTLPWKLFLRTQILIYKSVYIPGRQIQHDVAVSIIQPSEPLLHRIQIFRCVVRPFPP